VKYDLPPRNPHSKPSRTKPRQPQSNFSKPSWAEIAATNKAEVARVAGLKQKVENDRAEQFVTRQNSLRGIIKQQNLRMEIFFTTRHA
jgi:hypothetical protein